MAKYRKTIEDSLSSDNNYCLRCWNEFTALTPEDWQNLNNLRAAAKKNSPELASALDNLLHFQERDKVQEKAKKKEKPKKPKRKILCLETGEKFNTLKECGEALGISFTAISMHCNNGYPRAVKKMHFKYIYE